MNHLVFSQQEYVKVLKKINKLIVSNQKLSFSGFLCTDKLIGLSISNGITGLVYLEVEEGGSVYRDEPYPNDFKEIV